jgi:hypothetical protein
MAAERLFGKAADELQAAIAGKRIRAGSGGVGFSNAPVPGDMVRLVESTWQSAFLLFTVAGMEPEARPISSGPPADLRRMRRLTHTALAPVAKAGDSGGRSPLEAFHQEAFDALVFSLRIAYPICLVSLVVFGAWAVLARRTRQALLLAAGTLILIGSVLSFCAVMAAFDVLAAPTLSFPGGYNRLGYAPVSVVAAYAIVTGSFMWTDIRRREGHARNDLACRRDTEVEKAS